MVEEYFTAVEIKKLGRLVNNLGILASQIILRHQPALHQRAYENLQKLKKEEEEFLKKLDRMARRSQDESALRLIEDFDMQASVDVIQSQRAEDSSSCIIDIKSCIYGDQTEASEIVSG